MNLTQRLIVVSALLAPALAAVAEGTAAAGPDPVLLVFRWLHILGAATLLGGGLFILLVLRPSAAAVLSPAVHDELRAAVRSRWSKIIAATTLVLIITGFYNYVKIGTVAHSGQGPYHMLMGIKILLAFAVFFLAAMLAGKTGLAQKIQAKAGLWLPVTVGLGVIIVLIAGYLRFMPAVH